MRRPQRISRLNVLMLLVFAVVNAAADDATLLMTLKKEQLQMRYSVTSVQADCHDLQNSIHQQQLSESRQQYEAAAKALNVWLQKVHDSIVKGAPLDESSQNLWSTASEAKRKFLEFSLTACGGETQPGLPLADGTIELIKPEGLLVSFGDTQSWVNSLRKAGAAKRKELARTLIGNKWDVSAFAPIH